MFAFDILRLWTTQSLQMTNKAHAETREHYFALSLKRLLKLSRFQNTKLQLIMPIIYFFYFLILLSVSYNTFLSLQIYKHFFINTKKFYSSSSKSSGIGSAHSSS